MARKGSQQNEERQQGDVAEGADNTIKDPRDWKTGDEPMTGAQRSYLETLATQPGERAEVDGELTKAEASQKIDELRERTGKA